MAHRNHLPLLLLLPLATTLFIYPSSSNQIYPSTCSNHNTCTSLLYNFNPLTTQEIATFYSVNSSQINPIGQDNLVTVPCSCKNLNGTVGYFYDTIYKIQANDTFFYISNQIYSGQAWNVGGEGSYIEGELVEVHLLCGCVENESRTVVTYTVREGDTLLNIATLLSSKVDEIERLNGKLLRNSSFLDVGWVLFVPMKKNVSGNLG